MNLHEKVFLPAGILWLMLVVTALHTTSRLRATNHLNSQLILGMGLI